jgi:hypothetical protein
MDRPSGECRLNNISVTCNLPASFSELTKESEIDTEGSYGTTGYNCR